ncbi:putative fatty acid amide hydrolase [Helianthus annuus]|nr:putative fatty acid amide hydrolase [Helianthus annuus]
MLRETVIPEPPMFRPEFPPQEPEPGVVFLKEDGKSEDRVDSAIRCLPQYDPDSNHGSDSSPFRYWKIRDYAYSYRQRLTTPSTVAEHVISAIEEFSHKKPPTPLLISFDPEDVRKQAAASTRRFEEGKPLSILDGIFVAIKDDIDCYPHPSNGGTTWLHEVRNVKEDAVSVSRLRSCGAILVGKANMHELGMGTTGVNPNYGTARNPHDLERYTGGSSSGPAAIVASGICSAALGTDGGGSVRIPSSLCGVVGLKTTYGRTDIRGSLCDGGTVEIVGPITSSVEDIILVYAIVFVHLLTFDIYIILFIIIVVIIYSYAAILGSSPSDKICLHPSVPCLPDLSSHENLSILGSLRLGKYTEWFNDVFSPDISNKCEDALNMFSETHGCKILEIVIPELNEMRTAHVVSIGSEAATSMSPDLQDGRRIMYYHMEIFKNVDVIVTPTTGMTAPVIPKGALKYGESDMKVTGNLMRFIIAANLLGFPAISVPVGYDKQGLPIGLQIIGRPWAEATILRLAAAFEGLRVETKQPASYFDILKRN